MDLIHNLYQKIKIVFQNERKEIWLAKNTYDGQLCIIKLQYHTNDNKKSHARTVLHQGKFLQSMLGYTGIPFMYWAGRQEATGMAILIVERLGKTLEELFNEQGRRFSIKTTCMIGIGLIKMVHTFHDKGFTHGNLKPSSIQFGVGRKCMQMFFNDLIDSDLYIKKGRHIKQKESIRRGKINQFLSIDRLEGYGGGRRDDIESIIYMLVYFIKGSLPWSKYFDRPIFKKNPNTYEQAETQEETIKFNQNAYKQMELAFHQSLNEVVRKISETKVEQICEGVPNGLMSILKDCRATEFDERPDYNSYIRKLQKILQQNGFENDSIYDWMSPTNPSLILKKTLYKPFSLKIRNQKAILQQCYDPFQINVDL